MPPQSSFRLVGVLLLLIAVTHCKRISRHKHRGNVTKPPEQRLKIMDLPEELNPTRKGYALDPVSVINDATGVFRQLVSNIVSKKRFIGLDSDWYWR